MPREADLSTNERDFTLQVLRNGMRLDGRARDAFRPIELTFGDEYGAVDLRLGKTQIAVRVSCEVAVPHADRIFEGLFNIVCEFSPMASPAYEVGRPTTDEMLLSRILEKTIRRSSALDTESLCIVAGAQCFSLRADVHVLEHDGNVVDAACVAVSAALRHFRRLDVTVEGGRATVHGPAEREPVALSLLRHPLCVTFAYVDGGRGFVLDPTLAEEVVREGEVVVSVTAQAELCQVSKYGGATVDASCFVVWTEIAVRTVQRLEKIIQRRLDEDREVRNKGGVMEELRAENER